jgi:HSP20 family protein
MIAVRYKSDRVLAEKRRMVLETIGWQVRLQQHVWSPPTDLYETDNFYIVRVEIAGMREQDFSVVLDNNFLTVSGSRPDVPGRRAYHQMEVRFGEFRTLVALPGPVNSERTLAEYQDGFLTITLPKA